MPEPSAADVLCILRRYTKYDRSTGALRQWQNPDFRRTGIRGGESAGYRTSDGAVGVGLTVNGRVRQYRMHRVVWLLEHGEWPRHAIKHIDGDLTNNRIQNLCERKAKPPPKPRKPPMSREERLARRRVRDKEYKAKNAEMIRENEAHRRRQNPEREKTKSKRFREKTKNDPKYVLLRHTRSVMNRLLVGVKEQPPGARKEARLMSELGYTTEEFREHIESKFEPGMAWDNHGKGEGFWNVDHIVPLKWHLEHRVADLAVTNALSNLQPMWHTENMRKRASLEHLGPLFDYQGS